MQNIPEEMKKKVTDAIKERKLKPCPMCGNKKFQILDGYFNPIIQPNFAEIYMVGDSIPSIVLICRNCGFISQYSLKVLLPEKRGQI